MLQNSVILASKDPVTCLHCGYIFESEVAEDFVVLGSMKSVFERCECCGGVLRFQEIENLNIEVMIK